MWCLENSRCITPRYCLRRTDKHITPNLSTFKQAKYLNVSLCLRYVFHSAGILLEPAYENRVEYLGQLGTKNCSLRISDVRPSDSGTYVFYLITTHPTQKMPEQSGIQLLVAGGKFSLRLILQLVITNMLTTIIITNIFSFNMYYQPKNLSII